MSVVSSPKSPLKERPDCWDDETRMTALYAPFRERSLNPHDWDSKLTFWKTMVERWCTENNRCSFSLEELNKVFIRGGRIPLGLSIVVKEMLRQVMRDDILRKLEVRLTFFLDKQVCLSSQFSSIVKPSDSWSGWAVDLVVKRPAAWAWRSVKDMVIASSETPQTKYIHLSVLKSIGEALLSAAPGEIRGVLMDVHTLLVKCGLTSMTPEDAQLLLHWLQCQGHIAVVTQWNEKSHESQTLVKLRPSSNDGRVSITDMDRGIYALNCNKRALIHNLESLEKERQEALREAKSYLQKGMRSTAKSSLRKKKELEKCIEKRATALENVELLLTRIQEAESDSQVFNSYKLGVTALKQTFKAAGLSEDSVANTMDDVQEVLDLHNEIQSTLSEPVDSSVDEDLEGELAELLMADAPNAPSSGGGNELDDSTSSIDLRLKQLGVGGSPSSAKSSSLLNLPNTPRADLLDLPNVPCTMPSPAGDSSPM